MLRMSSNKGLDDHAGLRKARQSMFVALLGSLKMSQGGLSKWLNLKNTKQGREAVSRKYRGDVGVTPKDLALLNALLVLEKEGYDLNSVDFTDDGQLLSLSKLSGGIR